MGDRGGIQRRGDRDGRLIWEIEMGDRDLRQRWEIEMGEGDVR